MDSSTPSLNPVFIGHGSPMNALAKNKYSEFLSNYARTILVPKAIVVVSAHWQTTGTFITGNSNPEQLYDFYGFLDTLYKIKYAPAGSPPIAELICNEIPTIKVDPDRGIDHAGWAVVKHLYPDCNVPLLEISLDILKDARQHFSLGRQLGKLRNAGILFIGSGNLVHNLREISYDEAEKPFGWAIKADHWLSDKLDGRQLDELIDYERYFPEYKRSIPTTEHYLPLLYILGMLATDWKIKTIYEEIQNGSVSMRSIEVEEDNDV
ncbi:MAG: hypothetical protein A2087_12270 [Spirochaetes bacterium GWD1_61_31]|nr:MAG: hypothetical protein A2Y37_14960 [Spirochaetes bacterium GWB1_60_80]OHD33944.1 MAG: hypothetical protein A2004_09865 [Spirochaetes bacterium GWC1_61_12]OHD35150.1 MAG: hypothetical protein A2087_12270 [Spirochaetes bacterium GWD1_61_31]OHD41351.1 MAG: hypothetical protein A2Y35_12555 [Spirochaetes bacterium GWE1_60_18]OHD61327.1 MAG: hypothetical protein A2Y32_07000 [Spirochaetes bacterium GWF1_60_12]